MGKYNKTYSARSSVRTCCFLLVGIFFTRQILQAQEKPVNVSISSLSFVQAPYVVARDKGYFRQEGIDPRGKKVGTGGIGGLADVGTKRFLSAKGIDAKEVTFIVLGSSSVRMSAVLSGAVAAAPLSPPHDYWAKKSGLKVLGYFGDAFPSYMGGVGIHLDSLRNRPALIKGFVKASLKGLKFIHSRRPETIDMMMRHMKADNREMVEAIYDSSVPSFTKDGLLSPEAQQAIIAIAAQAIGRSEAISPEAIFDFRLAREANRELEAEGWKP